jgi:23S rRNA (adenine2503-C2)-methyltransferase
VVTGIVNQSPISAATSPEARAPLLGRSQAALTEWVQQQGQPAYRGKQLHQWIYTQGARTLADITVFPKQWRADMAAVPIGRSKLHFRSQAPDGTIKYLLRLSDGHMIEAVGIPTFKSVSGQPSTLQTPKSLPSIDKPAKPVRQADQSLDRLTVCVSSQVGCPMACDFCATGKGGFLRNLETHEIVDQVLTVQEDFQQRVSNIVFMGMGEPLINIQNVVAAVRCLNQDVGIGQRTMTISTVGLPGQIRRLAEHQLQVTLAVSLHASNQRVREQLIPSAQKYPLEALLDECRDYVGLTGRRITFEYILLAGLNDCEEHALELAQHLRGFQSHVNLIPYNPIEEVEYQRPSRNRVKAFTNWLKASGITVSVRYSRGLEKEAACGQLRASKLDERLDPGPDCGDG